MSDPESDRIRAARGGLVTKSPDRLYGLVGAERLYRDIADLYESQIDPYWDDDDRREWTVEEWTVLDRIKQVPSGDIIAEWLVECVAEDGMWTDEAWDRLAPAAKDEEVLAAAENLRAVVASKLNYDMADELVGTHTISLPDDAAEGAPANPLFDGEPIYRKRTDS